MPQSFVSPIANLVIAISATGSNVISGIKDARALCIYAPASPATLTGTVKVQVYPTAGTVSPRDLTSAAVDITVAAGDAVVITDIAFTRLRLLSSSAEGAARTFHVMKRWES